jgi:hypothetical protein
MLLQDRGVAGPVPAEHRRLHGRWREFPREKSPPEYRATERICFLAATKAICDYR